VIGFSAHGCAQTASVPGTEAGDGGARRDAGSLGADTGEDADTASGPEESGATDGSGEGDSALGGEEGGSTDGSGGVDSTDREEGGSMDGSGDAGVCNLVIGNSTTQQWFDGGFLLYPGIDATRWELFWVAHHYIDLWANPDDSAWSTPLDMGHACSIDATTPDRVIFIVTYAPPYPTETTYQTDLTSVVNDIQAKYPSARRIELMTLIRAPGNSSTACSSEPNNEQSIPQQEDQAIAMVAAEPAFAATVLVDPPLYVPSCSDFIANAPQYTDAGAMAVAQVYGTYYAAHP